MSYSPRLFVPGLSVHVIRRGINREAVFRDERDHLVFLHFLKRAAALNELLVHVYVLMKNHYHLIATPQNPFALPSAMKSLGLGYVKYFNKRYDRIGSPWTGKGRAIPIDSAMYWLTCARYVEQNPLRAGLVASPADYRWSSYRAHALGEPVGWLADHPVFHELGTTPSERQLVYRSLCETPLLPSDLVEQRYSNERLMRAKDHQLTSIVTAADSGP